MCLYCLRQAAGVEWFGKGTAAKPAYTAPGCDGRDVKEQHELFANKSTLAKYNRVLREGCVNTITGENEMPDDDG
jgi:hypothetical protein